MIEYSFSEEILVDLDKNMTPPYCFMCGNELDHDNYSNSCKHLKLVYSNEGMELVWFNIIKDLMKDFDDEGEEHEYDYLCRVSHKLNDEYLMITSSGWRSGIDVHFVFSHT
tara:strand:+ start:1883 stop:2215 length:333 start_codon:yes stop_codon:yes gene_type:complete